MSFVGHWTSEILATYMLPFMSQLWSDFFFCNSLFRFTSFVRIISMLRSFKSALWIMIVKWSKTGNAFSDFILFDLSKKFSFNSHHRSCWNLNRGYQGSFIKIQNHGFTAIMQLFWELMKIKQKIFNPVFPFTNLISPFLLVREPGFLPLLLGLTSLHITLVFVLFVY